MGGVCDKIPAGEKMSIVKIAQKTFPIFVFLLIPLILSGLADSEKIYWGSEVPLEWNGRWPVSFQTVPEKTGYERTSSSLEVLEYINTLRWNSECVHVFPMYVSELRKSCPVVVMANPRITSPEGAKKSGKPIIYLQGNIHPPEAEGKEALLLVMRDILLGNKKHLLDNQIILCCPNFNVDGNDTWTLKDGSPEIIGSRRSAGDYDLNRDAIKLESINVNGLYRSVLNRWDPVLFFDAHAMGRVRHGYAIVYATSCVPAAHPGPRGYVFDTLFPSLRESIRENFKIETFTHCLFDHENWPPTEWSHERAYWTTEGKFLTSAYGMRNRMSILVETPGDPPFEKRIYSQYAFITELLEYTNSHGKEMMRICRDADKETVEQIMSEAASGKLKNFIEGKYESWGKITLLAYPEDRSRYAYIPETSVLKKEPAALEGPPEACAGVEHLTKPVGTKESIVPRGYVIPAELGHIIEKLERHNIRVTVLKKPMKFSGTEYIIDSLESVNRGGYRMTRLKGKFVPFEAREFDKGAYKVDMAQPLASLIFYCLEPEVGDGFVGWGLFDEYLRSQGIENSRVIYPIRKYFRVLE